MQISTKLINAKAGGYNAKVLSPSMEALLIIVFLYKSEKINRQKMVAMFGLLREDKLLRRINTYHCRINDKWYSDEDMLTILKDVIYKAEPLVEKMEFNEFLTYVSLFLNKPRNYCIDYVQTEIIAPVLQNYAHRYNNYAYVNSFELPCPNIITKSYSDYEPSGYCCDDCDGDYDRYKSSEYERYVVEENIRTYKIVFADYLHSQKTKYKCYEIPKKEFK